MQSGLYPMGGRDEVAHNGSRQAGPATPIRVVLAVDLSVAGDRWVELIGELREQAPEIEILLLTPDDDAACAQRALSAGASGCVSAALLDGDLAQAVRSAARGEQFLSSPLAVRVAELDRSLTASSLTPREVEVLRLIALGHTSVEIAAKLHLSPRTVETHRAHIHKKLGLSTRAQLVRYALRRSLLDT
jgi:two-component system response regulator NreC